MFILETLIYIGYLVLFINIIMYIKGFSIKRKAFNIFTLYLIVMFLIQMSSEIYIYKKENNLFLSHYYFILQFILLSYFYISILDNNFQKNIIKVSVPTCLIILGVQYYLNNELFDTFNLFEVFITSFLLIIFSMFHFYNILNEKKEYYYINTGILLYLFSSTVLFIFGNLISKLDKKPSEIIWVLNAFLYIVYQVLIFKEWWDFFLKQKNKKNVE